MWLTDWWWTDCLAFCVTYSLFDWSSGWHAVLFYTLSDSKTGWPLCSIHSDWLTNWLTCRHCQTNWPTDWLTYLLFNIHTVWLVGYAGWLPVLLFTWQIFGFKLFTPGNFAEKCLSKQVKLCFWSVSDYKTVGFFSRNRFSVARGKKSYFYRLFLVSLSVFSLQTSRPSFDCSRVL